MTFWNDARALCVGIGRLRFLAKPLIAYCVTAGLTVAPTTSFAAESRPLAGFAVHHVQISVRDADRLADWYVSILGFRVTKHVATKGVKIVWIDIPGFRLGLAELAGSRRDPSQSLVPPDDTSQQGYRQIHFAVTDVDAAYRYLLRKGVHFVVPPTSYQITGIRLATMVDPEGNVLSLYQDLEPANALLPGRTPEE